MGRRASPDWDSRFDWVESEGLSRLLIRGRRLTETDRRSDWNHVPVLSLDQLPPTLMDFPVMPAAEQDLVVDLSAASLSPMHEMMPVAP